MVEDFILWTLLIFVFGKDENSADAEEIVKGNVLSFFMHSQNKDLSLK
jgi:hypothetical protein